MKFICPKAPAWTYTRNKINETKFHVWAKAKNNPTNGIDSHKPNPCDSY
jgi:hypothetical protein